MVHYWRWTPWQHIDACADFRAMSAEPDQFARSECCADGVSSGTFAYLLTTVRWRRLDELIFRADEIRVMWHSRMS